MALLLAIAVTLLAIGVIVLQSRNTALHHTIHAWKHSHATALSEAREWERKYWAEHTNGDTSTTSPPSHGVEDVDVETLMRESDDPVWSVVTDCRAAGIMNAWMMLRPDLASAPDHRKYSEFATYILQLPEDQRTVQGVALALAVTPRG